MSVQNANRKPEHHPPMFAAGTLLPVFLVTPIAGHAVDRLDRRKLMITVDLIRAGACLLPLLARTPPLLPQVRRRDRAREAA